MLAGIFDEHGHFSGEFPFGFRFLDLSGAGTGFSEALLQEPRCVHGSAAAEDF